MESNEFKKIVNELAKKGGFTSAFGGWFKESSESIVVLNLEKSNFGNLYYLYIKSFIQNAFGKNYSKSKELVKKYPGTIFRGELGCRF